MKNLRSKLGSNFAIVLYYLGFTLIWTHPLIFNLKSLLAGHGDAWQFVWNFWWVDKAIFEIGTTPFFTDYLHWPSGISLMFQTISILNTIIALPLIRIFGLVGTYNLMLLFTFVLTGFGTYLLARYITNNRFAAFVAGYIVTFGAFHMSHATGHLHTMSFMWVPLFILYFIKMVKGEGEWKLPALFIVLASLSDWYYLMYLLMFMAIYLVFHFFTDREQLLNKSFIKNFFFTGLSSLIVLLPYLGTMIILKVFYTDFDVVGHDPVKFSTDALSMIIPGHTWMFSDVLHHVWGKWIGHWEGPGFIGIGLLLLIIYTLIRQRNKVSVFWSLTALFFGVLALGPYLNAAGTLYTGSELPFYYMNKYVPFVSMQGVPGRMAYMMTLAFAIVGAIGISAIAKSDNKRRYIAIGVLTTLIFIEYLPRTFITSGIRAPEFYYEIAQDKEDYAILDTSDHEALILYYQTIHNKRLIGGYTSRPTFSTMDYLRDTPVLAELFSGEIGPDPPRSLDILSELNIRYVIVKNDDDSRISYIRSLALIDIYTDDQISVFEVGK